jgi:hypothetical protein
MSSRVHGFLDFRSSFDDWSCNQGTWRQEPNLAHRVYQQGGAEQAGVVSRGCVNSRHELLTSVSKVAAKRRSRL